MEKIWKYIKLEALAIWRAMTTERDRYQEGYEAARESMEGATLFELYRLLDESVHGADGDRLRGIPVDDFDIGWQDACHEELRRRDDNELAQECG